MGRALRLKNSLYRFWYRRFSRTAWKVVRFHGAEFVVSPSNYIDRRLWIEGGYERAQIDFLLMRARETPVDAFIDIGANFGLYSVIFAANRAAGSVHTFECDPRNLAHLSAHLRMNDLLDRVTVHPLAASDRDGTLSFEMAGETSTGRSRVVPNDGAAADPGSGTGRVVTVDARRVDQILTYRGGTLVIKIDVEGYERPVLRGLGSILSENRCLLQVEVLADDADLVADLTALGYREVHRLGADRYFSNVD